MDKTNINLDTLLKDITACWPGNRSKFDQIMWNLKLNVLDTGHEEDKSNWIGNYKKCPPDDTCNVHNGIPRNLVKLRGKNIDTLSLSIDNPYDEWVPHQDNPGGAPRFNTKNNNNINPNWNRNNRNNQSKNPFNAFVTTIPEAELISLRQFPSSYSGRRIYNDVHANCKYYYPEVYSSNDWINELQWADRANHIKYNAMQGRWCPGYEGKWETDINRNVSPKGNNDFTFGKGFQAGNAPGNVLMIKSNTIKTMDGAWK